MLVYLCRHAQAASGDPDELRPLTATGEEQAMQLGRWLASADPAPSLVVASPLLRARQTGELISRAAGIELRVDERLLPGAGVEHLRAVVDEVGKPVATVGHQPDCSEIAVALIGTDPGFPPAGVAPIDVEP